MMKLTMVKEQKKGNGEIGKDAAANKQQIGGDNTYQGVKEDNKKRKEQQLQYFEVICGCCVLRLLVVL